MSILSWDDFEDDEPKQAAPAQQPAPVESRRKRLMRKWYLMHTTRRRVWQLHNPLEPLPAEDQIQPIRWQEHLLP